MVRELGLRLFILSCFCLFRWNILYILYSKKLELICSLYSYFEFIYSYIVLIYVCKIKSYIIILVYDRWRVKLVLKLVY